MIGGFTVDDDTWLWLLR